MSYDRNLLPDPASYFENQGLVLKGPRSSPWKTTNCVFHGGSDSMRVLTTSGGWRCMACDVSGGDVLSYEMQAYGTEFVDACKALGAWVNDGKPIAHAKPSRLSARQALQIVDHETNLVAVAAMNIAQGVQLSDEDRARLIKAANRIHRTREVYK